MNTVGEIFKDLIIIIFYILDISILLYGMYFFVIGLFAFKKRNIIRSYKAKHKLAVLIAARNESKVIVQLINSLKKQKYPSELYDIFVIPNNCTDNTESVAKRAGAKIIDCIGYVKSKGDILKKTFSYMKENHSEYDAYVIFDADNIVHSNFLLRMNDAICAGYGVAQGYIDSKNPNDSWISSSNDLLFLSRNLFINKARTNIGISSFLNGTGFMVTKEIIEKFGYDTHTITEDIEFAIQCSLNGIKIGFVDDAITFDEQPVKFVQSWKQRIRWTVGMLECMKIYTKKLLKVAIKDKKVECIDMALFYVAPIVQVIQLFVFMIYSVLLMFNFGTYKIMTILSSTKGYTFLFGYVFCILASLILLKMENRSIRKSLKGIFTLFIFMLTWIPISIISLFKKEHVWEQIEHNRAVKIETLVDVD